MKITVDKPKQPMFETTEVPCIIEYADGSLLLVTGMDRLTYAGILIERTGAGYKFSRYGELWTKSGAHPFEGNITFEQ